MYFFPFLFVLPMKISQYLTSCFVDDISAIPFYTIYLIVMVGGCTKTNIIIDLMLDSAV